MSENMQDESAGDVIEESETELPAPSLGAALEALLIVAV